MNAPIVRTLVLLTLSNVFMTFAWYAHLRNLADRPWFVAALASRGIAFFEYALRVPANRIGYRPFELGQLKILQEVITLAVFIPFSLYQGLFTLHSRVRTGGLGRQSRRRCCQNRKPGPGVLARRATQSGVPRRPFPPDCGEKRPALRCKASPGSRPGFVFRLAQDAFRSQRILRM